MTLSFVYFCMPSPSINRFWQMYVMGQSWDGQLRLRRKLAQAVSPLKADLPTPAALTALSQFHSAVTAGGELFMVGKNDRGSESLSRCAAIPRGGNSRGVRPRGVCAPGIGLCGQTGGGPCPTDRGGIKIRGGARTPSCRQRRRPPKPLQRTGRPPPVPCSACGAPRVFRDAPSPSAGPFRKEAGQRARPPSRQPLLDPPPPTPLVALRKCARAPNRNGAADADAHDAAAPPPDDVSDDVLADAAPAAAPMEDVVEGADAAAGDDGASEATPVAPSAATNASEAASDRAPSTPTRKGSKKTEVRILHFVGDRPGNPRDQAKPLFFFRCLGAARPRGSIEPPPPPPRR